MPEQKNKHPGYTIMVMSDKGGVGKSVISINLAVALSGYGFKVLLVDGDMTHPTIGIQLGVEPHIHDISDFLKGKVGMACTISTHEPSGVDLLLCSIEKEPFRVNEKMLKHAITAGIRTKRPYDFIIVDTPAMARTFVITKGLMKHINGYMDEGLIIIVPKPTIVISTMKMVIALKLLKCRHRVVMNMRSNKPFEIDTGFIEKVLRNKVYMELPMDDLIPMSIYKHVPAVLLAPYSKFSTRIRQLAASYIAYWYPKRATQKIKQIAETEEEFEKARKSKRKSRWF